MGSRVMNVGLMSRALRRASKRGGPDEMPPSSLPQSLPSNPEPMPPIPDQYNRNRRSEEARSVLDRMPAPMRDRILGRMPAPMRDRILGSMPAPMRDRMAPPNIPPAVLERMPAPMRERMLGSMPEPTPPPGMMQQNLFRNTYGPMSGDMPTEEPVAPPGVPQGLSVAPPGVPQGLSVAPPGVPQGLSVAPQPNAESFMEMLFRQRQQRRPRQDPRLMRFMRSGIGSMLPFRR